MLTLWALAQGLGLPQPLFFSSSFCPSFIHYFNFACFPLEGEHEERKKMEVFFRKKYKLLPSHDTELVKGTSLPKTASDQLAKQITSSSSSTSHHHHHHLGFRLNFFLIYI